MQTAACSKWPKLAAATGAVPACDWWNRGGAAGSFEAGSPRKRKPQSHHFVLNPCGLEPWRGVCSWLIESVRTTGAAGRLTRALISRALAHLRRRVCLGARVSAHVGGHQRG